MSATEDVKEAEDLTHWPLEDVVVMLTHWPLGDLNVILKMETSILLY